MLAFHHVNLAVPPGRMQEEMDFLVQVLGLRRVVPDDSLAGLDVRWFEFPTGGQVHLSEDPDFVPSSRAHVAVRVGPDLDAVEGRVQRAGLKTKRSAFSGGAVVFCTDPAGNRWELRDVPD
ncbi:MAG TPA: VOC family protein [Mycobacteriales bacterium]|jgi:catechol 2,3-dioxygenase-like lactoylglutathione lyase family enzyme|nr:VOC family protein [Mycobacteriales bacterium]